jgi:hypothetical protein
MQAPLSLEHRRALLWIRANQPARMVTPHEPGVPSSRTRVELLKAGFIEFIPARERFDPVSYCLTRAGEEALDPSYIEDTRAGRRISNER